LGGMAAAAAVVGGWVRAHAADTGGSASR
jgi:hypothetical protein